MTKAFFKACGNLCEPCHHAPCKDSILSLERFNILNYMMLDTLSSVVIENRKSIICLSNYSTNFPCFQGILQNKINFSI
jgi:hypothetical protein